MSKKLWFIVSLLVVGLLALGLPAGADDSDDNESENGALEVRVDPAIAQVDHPVTIRAEYNQDDDGEECESEEPDEDESEDDASEEPTDDESEEDNASEDPTEDESDDASEEPTDEDSDEPTQDPTQGDTETATDDDSEEACEDESDDASEEPTDDESDDASEEPTDDESDDASEEPSDDASEEPTDEESDDASEESDDASEEPTEDDSDEPTEDPTQGGLEVATLGDSGHDDGDQDDGDQDDGDQDDGDQDGRPENLTVTFVVDYGDGSAPETMTVRGEDRSSDKEKAQARHAYTAEGEYTITVTATPEGGAPVSASVTVQVGRGSARLHGDDRFGTANGVSHEGFPEDGEASAVLLARADAFADALASAGMALLSDAPVLLTGTAEVPSSVLDEIARALGDEGTVYLLGGEAAIAPSVATQLAERGYQVVRISGDDRIDTALQIAAFLVDAGVEIDEVVLASAGNFPDALAGAAYAAKKEAPVLLTGSEALDPRVAEFLQQLGTDIEILVAGGETAISEQVVMELESLGFEVERLAGRDRFHTAAVIAEARFADATAVVLATGGNFPDALAGGAHAGRIDAPVLLVGDALPEEARQYLEAHAGQIDVAYVLGGTAVVSPEVMEEVETILGLDG